VVFYKDTGGELALFLDGSLVLFLQLEEVVTLHEAIRSDHGEAAVLLVKGEMQVRGVGYRGALQLADNLHLVSANNPDDLLISSEQILSAG
jgi:hypothetical protein